MELSVIDIAVVGRRVTEHGGVPDRFAPLQQTDVLKRLRPAPEPG